MGVPDLRNVRAAAATLLEHPDELWRAALSATRFRGSPVDIGEFTDVLVALADVQEDAAEEPNKYDGPTVCEVPPEHVSLDILEAEVLRSARSQRPDLAPWPASVQHLSVEQRRWVETFLQEVSNG